MFLGLFIFSTNCNWIIMDHSASFAKYLEVIKVAFSYGKTQWVDEHEIKLFELLNARLVTLIVHKACSSLENNHI